MQEAVSQLIKAGEMQAPDAKTLLETALRASGVSEAKLKALSIPMTAANARNIQHG